ncbi:hypothetical protein GCM10008927_27830 [Amylibacter ulvae]|uniref:Phasin domain-containing protein n=2 Tax=Paramylibacter ulvae TaxID=1651968 RepID=A0ABQ3DBG5_9RHOB|nr:hypothetical protein GCM10008927_27830 [Amylibacter ulvae]
MANKVDGAEAVSKATNTAIEKTQEIFAKSTAASEKFVEGLIEVNASAFKGAEVVAKKAYDNYVSNVTTSFDDAKALAKSADVAEFVKIASSTATKSAEKYSAQGKELAELSQKIFKDNLEISKKFYASAFKAA